LLVPTYLPHLSVYDPAESAEGSLDPLGLALLAGRLADKLVPGFTERSRRPRFLTVLAVGSRVLSRPEYPDGVHGDHKDGPANIAFERLVNEAFAHRGTRGEAGLLGIPGIGKAREATAADARLSSTLYLKAPGAVGLWVAYKRLARDLEILDDDGHLLENGAALLDAWEEGIGKKGLLTGTGSETEAFLREMDSALEPLLGDADSRWKPQRVWAFIYTNLRPETITGAERTLLRDLVLERNPTRREVFLGVREELRRNSELIDAPAATRAALLALRGRVGDALGQLIDTILAYEDVVVLLRRAFLSILCAGGRRADGRVDADIVLADHGIAQAFRGAMVALPGAVERATAFLENNGEGELAHDTLEWLRDGALRSPAEFFEALIVRHIATQRRKPPDGRRPWIEGETGFRFVRTRYIEEEPPQDETVFHPYRMSPVKSFIEDLWAMQNRSETEGSDRSGRT